MFGNHGKLIQTSIVEYFLEDRWYQHALYFSMLSRIVDYDRVIDFMRLLTLLNVFIFDLEHDLHLIQLYKHFLKQPPYPVPANYQFTLSMCVCAYIYSRYVVHSRNFLIGFYLIKMTNGHCRSNGGPITVIEK